MGWKGVIIKLIVVQVIVTRHRIEESNSAIMTPRPYPLPHPAPRPCPPASHPRASLPTPRPLSPLPRPLTSPPRPLWPAAHCPAKSPLAQDSTIVILVRSIWAFVIVWRVASFAKQSVIQNFFLIWKETVIVWGNNVSSHNRCTARIKRKLKTAYTLFSFN